MTSIRIPRPIIAAVVLTCGIGLIPAAALAVPAGPASPARAARPAPAAAAAAASQCTAGHTAIWLGLGPGGGAAGSTFYPLEFSNIGHRSCWLFGYPGVSAINGRGHRIGPPANHSGRRHRVTLRPGATAHAILQVIDAGNVAGCHRRTAAGLRVFAPGQTRSTEILGFSFQACSNRRVLGVGPVRPGTGIPGFTSS
jgi:hypothetical protein